METHKFINYAEIHLRLHATVVQYDRRPVMAYSMMGSLTPDQDVSQTPYDITVKDLVTGDHKKVSTDDPLLDISSPPLGYLNHPKVGPGYLVRDSLRVQKQGIDLSYLYVIMASGEYTRATHMPHAELGKAILGEYPEFGKARQEMIGMKPGLAWDRRFALIRLAGVPCVAHRGQVLGPYDPIQNSMHVRKAVEGHPALHKLQEWMKLHV